MFSTSRWSVFYKKLPHSVYMTPKLYIISYIAVQCYMFWKLLRKAICLLFVWLDNIPKVGGFCVTVCVIVSEYRVLCSRLREKWRCEGKLNVLCNVFLLLFIFPFIHVFLLCDNCNVKSIFFTPKVCRLKLVIYIS